MTIYVKDYASQRNALNTLSEADSNVHAFSEGNIDTNGILFIQINKAINETAFYFNNN